MPKFDTDLYNAQVMANQQRAQNFNDTFNMLMQQSYQRQQAEADATRKAALDPANILAKARTQGYESLSPQEQAILDIEAQKAQRTYTDPITQQVITQGGFPEYRGGDLSQHPIKQKQQAFQDAQQRIAQERGVPVGIETSPYAEKARFDEELRLESQKAMEDLKAGRDALATDKQRKSAQFVIDRMREINEQLKSEGAIVSEEGDNVGAYLSSTGVGQEASKIANPKVQALRDEYKKLQSTFLPFYASAAGLGAKSLDSEGERKSILDSFGDPAGIYEANKRQLENLSTMVGSGGVKAQGQKPSIGDEVGGYRFLGGDPSKQENWELVK